MRFASTAVLAIVAIAMRLDAPVAQPSQPPAAGAATIEEITVIGRYPGPPLWKVTSGGLIFLPLLWLQSTWLINALLYVVFVAGYCVILLLLRIVTLSEVTVLGRAFRSKNAIFDGSKSVRKEYLDG